MLINTESLIKNISSVSRIPFRQIPKTRELLDSNQKYRSKYLSDYLKFVPRERFELSTNRVWDDCSANWATST